MSSFLFGRLLRLLSSALPAPSLPSPTAASAGVPVAAGFDSTAAVAGVFYPVAIKPGYFSTP